ncbi:MAG: hypothetical protein FWC77_07140 [Defluviitaleaceae bacterium]|nr:hypothetical protein [Defluviitaleaceae bacterium]
MENKQPDTKPVNIHGFEEDDFDLQEHKKAANTVAQEKAHAKSARRKVAVGRVVIMIAAIAICGLLWLMASMIVRAL